MLVIQKYSAPNHEVINHESIMESFDVVNAAKFSRCFTRVKYNKLNTKSRALFYMRDQLEESFIFD